MKLGEIVEINGHQFKIFYIRKDRFSLEPISNEAKAYLIESYIKDQIK